MVNVIFGSTRHFFRPLHFYIDCYMNTRLSVNHDAAAGQASGLKPLDAFFFFLNDAYYCFFSFLFLNGLNNCQPNALNFSIAFKRWISVQLTFLPSAVKHQL